MKNVIELTIENEEIVFADLTNREDLEIVVVCKSGNVFLFDSNDLTCKLIGNLDFSLVYEEDLFAYYRSIGESKETLHIHSYMDYVCIVQEFGQTGVVFDLKRPKYKKFLQRGDYCVGHCSFPIAFYENAGQTFLIHGTDWNRLDITCLEIDELLTDRVVDYDTQSNYFDYFHSSLCLSPDEKYFVSNGWHWHPYGQITLYSIDGFLETFEVSHKDIILTDEPYNLNWNQPLCWSDEKTLVVGFNKNTENEGKTNFPNELLFVDAINNTILKRVEFNGLGITSDGNAFGDLFYDRENMMFVSLNRKSGLYISDVDGKKIYENNELTSHKYSLKHKLIYRIDNQSKVYEYESIENLISGDTTNFN